MRKKTALTLTDVRHTTHGLFEDVAATSEALMDALRKTKNWLLMSAPRREALKMIMHKAARIGAGDFNLADHWDDIGGYAKLGKQDGQFDALAPVVLRKSRKVRPAKKPVRKARAAKKKKVAARPAKSRVAKRSRARPAKRVARTRQAAPVTQVQQENV